MVLSKKEDMVRIKEENEEQKTSLADFLKQYMDKLKTWLAPNPADSRLLQIVKLFFKCIAILIMIALSPIIAVVLLFVFFAAV